MERSIFWSNKLNLCHNSCLNNTESNDQDSKMKDKKTNNLCKLSKKLNLAIGLDQNLITQLLNTKQENLTNSNLLLQMKMKKLNILS